MNDFRLQIADCRLTIADWRFACGSDLQSAERLRAAGRQARQDLNLQPPVLETGALPIELRAYEGR